MSTRKAARPDRYAYISGRIRVMELKLLDSAGYSRLYDARTKEDVGRVLSENGYPEARDPETSLKQEQIAVFALLRDLMPDKQFIEILLMFHDFHNIKVVLKYLSPWWPRQGEEISDGKNILEMEIDQDVQTGPSLQVVQNLLQYPALIEPGDLFQALAERRPGQIPIWAYNAALAAVRNYQNSYDVADIDLVLDRLAFREALAQAEILENDFFTRYLRQRVDLINMSILLRSRYLQSGVELLQKSLIAGGFIDYENILALYGADAEKVEQFFRASPYASLAELVSDYGDREIVTRFSQEIDNILISHIGKARLILSGPEVPLAYLLAREMEIRNVRIILACLRNDLPMSKARSMARDSYLSWR